MGRLGKLPVQVPQDVTVTLTDSSVEVKGPKGTLSRALTRNVTVKQTDDGVLVTPKGSTQEARAMQGTLRAHIKNMVHGVTEGWTKELEISGPGYRAEARGKELILTVGYSHPVTISATDSMNFAVEKNVIKVEGIDKEDVGHVAALIRGTRKPNVYTGAGIKYATERVRRKAGKQAGAKE